MAHKSLGSSCIMGDLTLTTCWKVNCGDMSWTPDQKMHQDRPWFLLGKWDRHFVKFMTGKALDLRRDREGASVNSSWMDEVFSRRQMACNQALVDAYQLNDDEDQQPKKKLKRSCTAADVHLLPSAVTMKLPEAPGFPEREVQVLVEGIKTTNMWLPLELEVLSHIKAGVMNSEVKPRKSKEAVSK